MASWIPSIKLIYISCCILASSCHNQAPSSPKPDDSSKSSNFVKHSEGNNSTVLNSKTEHEKKPISRSRRDAYSEKALNSAFRYNDHIIRNLLQVPSQRPLNYARSHFFMNLLRPLDRRTARFSNWDDHSVMHFGKRSMEQSTMENSNAENQEEMFDENKRSYPWLDHNVMHFGKRHNKDIELNPFLTIGPTDAQNTDTSTSQESQSNPSIEKKFEYPFSDHNTMHFGKRSGDEPWHNMMSFGKKSGMESWNGHNTMHFGKRESDPWHNKMSFGKRYESSNDLIDKKSEDPWHRVMSFGKKSENPFSDHSTMHFGKRDVEPWHNIMSFGKKSESPWKDHSTMHFGKRSDIDSWHQMMSFGKRGSDEPWHNMMSFGKKSENPWNDHSTMHFGKKYDRDSWHEMMSFGKRGSDDPWHSMMSFGKRSNNEPWHSMMSFGKKSEDSLIGINRDDDNNEEPNMPMQYIITDLNLKHNKKRSVNLSDGNSILNDVIGTKRFDNHNTMHFGKKSDPWQSHNTLHFGKKSDPWQSHNTMHFGKKSNPWDSHNTLHFGKKSNPWNSHSTMHFGKKSNPWESHNTMHFGKRTTLDQSNDMSLITMAKNYNQDPDGLSNFLKRSSGTETGTKLKNKAASFNKEMPKESDIQNGKGKSTISHKKDKDKLRLKKRSTANNEKAKENSASAEFKERKIQNYSKRTLKSIKNDDDSVETKTADNIKKYKKTSMLKGKHSVSTPDNFKTKENKINNKNIAEYKKQMSKVRVSKRSLTSGTQEYGGEGFSNKLQIDPTLFDELSEVEPTEVILKLDKPLENHSNQEEETQNTVRLRKNYENPWESHFTMHFGKKSDPWEYHGTLHFGKKSKPWESHNTLHFGKKFDPWESHNTMHFGKKSDPWEHNTMHFGKKSDPWESHNTMHFGKKFDPWESHNTMHFGKKSDPWESHNTMHFGKKSDPWESHNTMHFGKKWGSLDDQDISHLVKRDVSNALHEDDNFIDFPKGKIGDVASKELSELLLTYISYLKEHNQNSDIEFQESVNKFLEKLITYLDDEVLEQNEEVLVLTPDILSILLQTKQFLEQNAKKNVNKEQVPTELRDPQDSVSKDLETLNVVNKLLQKIISLLDSNNPNEDGSTFWIKPLTMDIQETDRGQKSPEETSGERNGGYKTYFKMKRKQNKRYWAPFQGPKSIIYPHAWYASQIRRSVPPTSDMSTYAIRMAEKKEDPINSFMHFG